MNAAGGFSPPSRCALSSATLSDVTSCSVLPERYVSGCASFTAPAGISTVEYFEYGEMASVAAEWPW